MRSSIINRLRSLRAPLAATDGRSLSDYQHDQRNAGQPNHHGLLFRLADTFSRTWDLGFTAFGGPPVHFQIMHRRFVQPTGGKVAWVDEQANQEVFAVCQSLPGPASTKMLFCLILLHAGLIPAICGFFIWSLPGAVGMYLLSLGIGRIGTKLPGPVYGLLSGLNASTVGIIALAAVQLTSRAISDRLTRILVIFGACAGLCYSALWYFPVLMVAGGLTAAIWDVYLSRAIGKARARLLRRRREQSAVPEDHAEESIALPGISAHRGQAIQRPHVPPAEPALDDQGSTAPAAPHAPSPHASRATALQISSRQGVVIIVCFFVSFVAILTIRALLPSAPLGLDIFANMYLAGTIIFGGGPVVIPLLREYVVQPGWVSPRDFLIGLAIIQAFPGPNFNFAVYLCALAVKPAGYPSITGAMLGFVGIFFPGMVLALGVQGLWQILRTKAIVASVIRGINATAVGLIFTAVYRLWELGYLTPSSSDGQSLALEPWWVVVAAVTYSGSAWFKVPPPVAILAGGALGLMWYVAVGRDILY